MTTATLATNNAAAAADALLDARRITEADPDFQRLHAQTVRKLLASLRAYVRALRTTPASDHPHIATAFIHRQVDILRTAYAAAHKEGVRDYYGAFSRTPGRWLHLAPSAAPHIVVRRLGFYAPSVAKMAHEALQAWGREQAAAATAPANLAENIPISILLAGDPPANTGDFLDGIGNRVNLQAEITWSGFNDGYVDAGGSDPANPYNLISWVLNPPSKHCGECPVYAANSPYDPPWVQGGNQLDATPGDGHTECGAGCKCSLEYVSAAAAGAAGQPDPRGTVWDSPNGPTPPPGPDGQPGKWPNIAGVADMSTLAPEQQQALQGALDAYRRAFERWEAIRGTLPSLPDMFGVAGGEGAVTGGVWPEWESLSPSQQKALGEVYQALSDYNFASGAPSMEEVQAGLGATQQQMDAILAQSQEMRDQLADMVAAAQAEQQQTQQELFGGGLLRNLLRQILMGLDDWIDLQKDTWYQLFHGGNGDNGGGDQQFADAADADAIRLYNKNHYPKGTPRGGQFMPNNGGGGGGSGEGHTTVEYAGAAHEAHLAATLGRAVTADDLARLTASPHGSHIRVVGSYVMSTHPDGTVIAVGVTGKHADGDLALHLDYRARGDDRHVSYTADQVRQIADAAQALGIAQVTTKGRRFSDDHTRLPRYGFDCPIHEALHESRYHVVSLQTSERAPRPPESFLHAGRLSEALVHADAREWWAQYGLSPHMEFDTAPGSASRQRLDAALREEGARAMADPLDLLTRPTAPEPDYSQPDGAHGFRKLTKAERRRLNALWVRAFGPIPPWQDEWGPEPTDDGEEE